MKPEFPSSCSQKCLAMPFSDACRAEKSHTLALNEIKNITSILVQIALKAYTVLTKSFQIPGTLSLSGCDII